MIGRELLQFFPLAQAESHNSSAIRILIPTAPLRYTPIMRLPLSAPTWIAMTLLSLHGLPAQVVPTTPTKFGKRNVGSMTDGGGSANIGLSPNATQPKPTVREISYIALSDARQWTSTDGKALIGKLIAFEQTEQVLPAGQTATPTTTPTAPVLPARPTLIRTGNVRLLVQQKAFELPLDRLAQPDRDFILQLDAAIAKKAATPKP
jgi:hypothetical protein